MTVHDLSLLAVREDRGRFAALNERRVLIYWPHGLGDFVHLSAIAPLLEPSNRYALTRFGDDYVSLYDGSSIIVPIASGVMPPGDGGSLGTPHLGLTPRACDGRVRRLTVPQPLAGGIDAFAPDTVLWTDYPETEGRTPFPFHTKARNLARLLVRPERLAGVDLSQPLPSTLDFSSDAGVQALVDERLLSLGERDARFLAISRTGYTAARKNWGDGSQARAFFAGLRAHDRRWRAISMDEEDLGAGSAGFRALFRSLDIPFARLYKAVAARLALFVGVPAGPLHVTMARGGVPVVGIWIAHHPDWYDEPNRDAVHLIGREVTDRGFDRRPATTTKPASLAHRIRYLPQRQIEANDALEAALLAMG